MVRYQVIAETSLQSFTEACEARLKDGWELVGGVAIREKEFVQSLTKTETIITLPTVKKKSVKKRSRATKAVRPKK